MENIDESIEHYRSLNPKPMPFTYLVRLDNRLYQPLVSDEKDQLIDVWLGRQNKLLHPQRLRITLYGAQFVKLRALVPGMNLYIDIISIRHRQLSDLYYALIDLEDTSELIYCRRFEIRLQDLYLDDLA